MKHPATKPPVQAPVQILSYGALKRLESKRRKEVKKLQSQIGYSANAMQIGS